MEDQFAKRATAKTERVAKNELHRLKNLAAAKNIKVPKTGLALTDHLGAKQLHTALTVARSSTASLGKFQAKLPKEKDAKKVGDLVPSGKKRKQPMPKPGQERESNIAMVDDILRKKPKVDLDKAVNREIFHKEQE
jgi:regulator of ribosome biosynthesis